MFQESNALVNQAYLQLSKYPALNNFEQPGSPASLCRSSVLGLGAPYFHFQHRWRVPRQLCWLHHPGYYSLEALFSCTKADDTTWLTLLGHFTPS